MEERVILKGIGTGGESDSSIYRRKRTKEVFNEFLVLHGDQLHLNHRKTFDECTAEELGDLKVYEVFADCQ